MTDDADGGGDGDGSNGSAGGGESSGRGERGGDGSGDRRETSTAEKVVMGVSVGFTLILFAYAGWQIATAPEAEAPRATVVGTERIPNGGVAVTVRLRNRMDAGLVAATVQSGCSTPPSQVRLSYIPASSTRTATLVCPANTTDPDVSVANWVRR